MMQAKMNLAIIPAAAADADACCMCGGGGGGGTADAMASLSDTWQNLVSRNCLSRGVSTVRNELYFVNLLSG